MRERIVHFNCITPELFWHCHPPTRHQPHPVLSFSCTITFSARIRNGCRLLGKMAVPSRPPSIFRPPRGRGGKKQSGEEFEQRSFFSSQQCDAFEGGLSPPQRLPWLRTAGLLNLIRDPNISQEIDYLKCLTFNRSAVGISEECRKVQRRHFCRLFIGGGALPSAKWKELSLLAFSDAPPHLCICGKSEL